MAFSTRSTDKSPAGQRQLSEEPEGSASSGTISSPSIQVPKSERGLRIAERIVFAIGICLFLVLVGRVGLDNVLANLQLVGWGILLIIAAEIVAFIANTLGWRLAFPRRIHPPRFGQLLLARIAGDGFNYLTPTATMGGEFVRIRMLQGQAPVVSLAASVAVAKLTQTIGLLVFVVGGLFLVIDELRLSAGAHWSILASLVLFAGILAGLLLLQRRSLLSPALGFAQRWPGLRFLARFRGPIERIDAEMAQVHRESSGRVVFSSAAFALGFAYGTVETYLILWFFGIPVTFKLALAVEVLGVVLNNLMFFVPLRAGTQEAGKALVFALLGLSPVQGLAAGVVYRIRELTWAFIGLAILARSHLSIRSFPTTMESPAPYAAGSPAEPRQDRRAA
ncbi:MAG TPA: lysylphosphatidylglycerol synthase domain-containing protein [Terrimicrobiaceae bacterium]|nr:lysylphosphatidylglycerol synthase domain-containing protein [Terrimicrobiaceae bacterium]